MKIIENVKLDKPLLVFTGYHGSGKSTSANEIKNTANIGITVNKYDYVSRYILQLCNVNDFDLNLKKQPSDHINLLVNLNMKKYCNKFDYIKHVQNLIEKHYNKMNDDAFNYFIYNIIKYPNKTLQILDNSINDQLELFNLFYKHKNIPDVKALYKLSKMLFDTILDDQNVYNRTSEIMETYKSVINNSNLRLLYYAYELDEVKCLKNDYNATVIQIDMDHVIRSNALAAQEKFNDLQLLHNDKYVSEMEAIKNEAHFIIKNDYHFKNTLHNKIISIFNS